VKVGQRIVEIVFKGVDNTSGAFNDMQKKLGQMGKDVPLLGAAFDILKNPIALATTAVVGLASAIKKAYDQNVKLGASFQDMANRTDMSVESLSKWRFIAEQNGSSIDEFEQAFRKLRNTMADAATGNAAAVATFAKLGVSATDANGNMRDLETVLLEIGQAVRDHGAASIEGAAAQDVLGRSSAGVVAIIKQETGAIRAQMSEASAYTASMTTAWAAAADAADDAAAKAKIAGENIRAGLMPAKAEIQNWWTDLLVSAFDADGWVKIKNANEEAARATAHAVAVGYLDGLIGGLEQGASSSTAAQYDAAIIKELEASGKKAAESAAKAAKEAADAAWSRDAASFAPKNATFVWTFQQDDADQMQSRQNLDEAMKALLDSTDIDFSEMNARLGPPIETMPKGLSEEMQAFLDNTYEVRMGLQDIGTTAIDAFLNGEAAAMKFGDMIRRTITRAIAEAIMKFIVLKAISAATGIPMAQGGTVPRRAFGGQIPNAANGYAVPDGPRGMDSRMIMAMPGEEVINRRLSMRLDRMVSAYELGAAVSPFALSGAGGGRGTVVNFNVARPVSVLDALSLGKDAVTASRKFSEARL
jgi:hypothetical protein